MPRPDTLTIIRAGLLLLLLLAACVPAEPAAIVELNRATLPPNPTPQVIYVTPTREPTAIPTAALPSPSATLTQTPSPSPTNDPARQQALCSAILEALYTQGSDLCLNQPDGYFCNGGLPPSAQPTGGVSSALAVQGSLVEANEVTMVHTAPLNSNNSGGLMWLRLDDAVQMSALLLGDVRLQDITPPDANLPPWQSITVQTRSTNAECANLPNSTFLVQGPYGRSSRLAINGVSLTLNGTVAIQTHGQQTVFIVLEGETDFTVYGQTTAAFAGQQLNVSYEDGDFSRPLAVPAPPVPLDFDHIHDLPIMLLDRPVLLPQPGYVTTLSEVNMRAEPTVNSRLLFRVPEGERLSVLGMNTEQTWYHLRLGNGEMGWMRGDLVAVDSLGTVDVLYDAAPTPPQRYNEDAHQALVVANAGGNLRTAPDVGFGVVTTLPAGTEITLLARSPYSPWVKVDAGGTIGWMALITIETQSVIGFLPIDYDVPLPPGPTATPIFTFGGGHAYPDPNSGQ